jgi:acyl-CoA synthetase (AMP-forming)/AMP-acid ligase II/thioesterase domain-containing protein/NADP-dependent 3-hydroxy acid dehydrogenase YdfG/acyl carrier protein
MDNIEDIYELSPMQQGILFHSLYEQSSGMYFHQLVWSLQGQLNIDNFKQAWHNVVARHAVLRTSFHWQELEKPLQVVYSDVHLSWVEHSWCGLTPAELQAKREAFLLQDSHENFHLDTAPLMRFALIQLGSDRYEFIWSLHHLLLDGWSMAIVLQEVFQFYATISQGVNLYLPPPTPFREYIVWLQQQDFSQTQAFWKKTLQGWKTPTPLPALLPVISAPRATDDNFKQLNFQLTKTTTTALQSLARTYHLTLSTIFQGVWALLLSCYTGELDVVFGVTVSGRPPTLTNVESMVGVLINTVPMRVKILLTAEILPWLQELQTQQFEQQQHSYMPLVEVQMLSEIPQGLPLFNTLIIFQNYPADNFTKQADLTVGQIQGTGHTNYPLTVMVSPDVELSVRIKYDSNLFTSRTINEIGHQFFGLLEAIASCPQANIQALTTNLQRQGKSLKLLEIEIALISMNEIADCYVLEKEDIIIAYIVLTPNCQQNLTFLGKSPDVYIQVSTIPLTDTGEVNELLLQSLPIIDGELIQQWEIQLSHLPEIEQVVVVKKPRINKLLPLHLSQILPNIADFQESHFHTQRQLSVLGNSNVSSQSLSPAISHGKPLSYPENLPQNLAELLILTAKTSSKNIIYIQPDGSEVCQSYADLLKQAQKISQGLQKLGLQPQTPIILQLKRNLDFVPAFWGCILGGFVPVPVEIASTYSQVNTVVSKLHHAWQMLDRPLIITSKELLDEIASLSKLLGMENLRLETCDRLQEYNPDIKLNINYHPSQPSDLAILLLTSGSTGTPKGVMLNHSNILSSIFATSEVNNLTAEDISLNWLPLDHPGPLIRCCIRCVFLGCTQIHVPTELILSEPLRWFDLLASYRVTTTWSPNFALSLVNEKFAEIKQKQWDLSTIKSFLNTAEPIVLQTAQRFLQILAPHKLSLSALQSSWGMAETTSSVTFSDQFLHDNSMQTGFAELGLPIPGISLRIVNEENQVLPEGTIGYLQVKGQQVTPGYYQNPALNQTIFTPDGWLVTGDLGFLQAGRLTITGREKDVIIVNGVNYYSHEIEAVVEKIADIEASYTAAVSVEGNKLAIFFVTPIVDDSRLLKEKLAEIQEQIISQIGIQVDYFVPVDREIIPKTSIGKIQRSQLSKRWESGEFKLIQQNIDILLENHQTIPDWFYRQIWQPKQIRKLKDIGTGTTLIFVDQLGLGDYLVTQLQEKNQSCIQVLIGSEFARIHDYCYSINPACAEDYYLLLKTLATQQKPIDYIQQIIHLWNYSEYKGEVSNLTELAIAQNIGVYSLLFLVQALVKNYSLEYPIQLLFVSSHTQGIETDDQIAYEKSTVLGLLKTIPEEIPQLLCRHIDLEVWETSVNGDIIFGELQDFTKEKEVAYRHRQRLVPRLEKINWLNRIETKSPSSILLKTGGCYLLTGGLGGIGEEIAKYLLEKYQAQLIIVGRTPLSAAKLNTFEKLQQLGGNVIYEVIDIGDQTAIAKISHISDNLDGVIHLAGVSHESLIELETSSGLAETLHPKVFGTWILHQLIKDHPDCIFINFSSVNGFFGGTSAGSYAAANSFLDAFSNYQRNNSSLRSYCLAWSMWEETGMSQGNQMKQLSRERGYYPIQKQQGIYSFLAGISLDETNLIIGLDNSKKNIQKYQSECENLEQLTAYFIGKLPKNLPQVVTDRFHQLTTCELNLVAEIPLTASGEIDIDQLTGITTLEKKREQIAPRNDIEREIAQIWQEVLKVENIGIYDNFFQLGGHSLKAIQLVYKLQNKFSTALTLPDLFKTPNIAGLAQTIQQQLPSQPFSCLVPIQPQGNRPPFFCIHPVGGNVLCYADLANYLGQEQPFYGLQSVGLNGEAAPITCLEDIATHYIQAIQSVQATGPYYLGGWSLGGIIAFEIAQQLSKSGAEIGLLALIDSYTPQAIEQVSQLRKSSLFTTVGIEKLDDTALASYYFAQDLGSLFGKQLEVSLAQLQTLEIDAQLGYILEQARIAEILPPDLELSQIRCLFQVFQANIQARINYQPQTYTGEIVLFCASEKPGIISTDSSLGWEQIALGGLEKHIIAGGHYEIIKSWQLAKKLRGCLKSF